MEGTLDRLTIPEILRALHVSRESGILHLSRGNTTKSVYFKDGAIVFASTSAPNERLGQRLVQSGALKPSELDLACRVTASSHLRLGATLVELGYLSPEKLDEVVREQVTSILCSVFPWDSGAFRTEEVEDPVDPDLARRDLSLENVLLEGIRHIESADAIRRSVGDLTSPLACAVDPSRLPPDLRLTAEEGFVLSRVDGVTSAKEIAAVSPLGEEQTLRCLYALTAAGLLRSSAPGTEGSGEPVLPPETLRFLEEMREKYARTSQSTLYEILDADRDASAETIRAAYFRLVKWLHPDHRVGLKLKDPEGMLDALYLEVKDAYEILSDEAARRRYDFELEQAKRISEARLVVGKNSATPKSALASTESARLHFANGERFFAEGRYHEAVEELRNAVRLDPSRAAYHRLLGRALARNPRWRKQAEEQFWKAIEIDRFDSESYLELGDLYEQSGLETRSRKMFEEALGVDPDNERALEKLASGRGPTSALGRLKNRLHFGRE